MIHASRFVLLMEKVAPFLRKHHARWRNSSDESISEYCAWFWNRHLMAVSCCNDEVHGVCLIKLFDRLEQWLEDFPFNPTGKFCLVDLLVATSPVAIAELFNKFSRFWGPQEIVMWERGERTQDSAPRMFSWDQYIKLTSRLTYGLVERERMVQ